MGIIQIFMHDQSLDKDKHNMAAIVQKSAVSLLQTVNDILDLSKIEAGSITLKKTSFDLKDKVSDIMESISVIARSKGVSLNIHYEQDNIPYLIGDPFQLNRILTNILSNAIKYTDKGRIDLVINCTPLPLDTNDTLPNAVEIEFIIQDTGIGMTQKQLNIIFDKFTQADESITRKYGGTGLGLSIVKELVDLMDGNIDVKSKLGEGSTFCLKIPFEATEKISSHKGSNSETQKFIKPTASAIKPEDAKILVVEDHPLNQSFIEILLNRMQIGTIDIVENGALAVKASSETTYDVILMDCHMPEKNGYEATIEIRKGENSDKHIPIIALTADAMIGTREKCLDAGMDEYITKPVDVDQLQNILNQWIDLDETEHSSKKTDIEQVEDTKDQPPVGLAALESYADTPEEMQQYISVFLNQTEKDLKILAEHCQGGENKNWVETAHKLKGGAGMAGALHMQQLCARAQALNDATLEERTALLEDIQQAFKEVKDFLEKNIMASD